MAGCGGGDCVPLKIETGTSPVCVLSIWTVADAATFVDVLAWLYIRKSRHAQRVMNALAPGDAAVPGNEYENARILLSVRTDDIASALSSTDPEVAEKAKATMDTRTEHRDGLLFQHMSWVAAYLQFPTAKARPPHVRVADKGFDGLLVQLGDDGLARVVLCEDKATIGPRNMVTQKVWPELKTIIAGERDLEILDAVTGLLDTMVPGDDVDRLLVGAVWERLREFRVAVTAGPGDLRPDGYGHIFGGYDKQVAGAPSIRQAEVLPLADIRGNLANLASLVIARLWELEPVV